MASLHARAIVAVDESKSLQAALAPLTPGTTIQLLQPASAAESAAFLQKVDANTGLMKLAPDGTITAVNNSSPIRKLREPFQIVRKRTAPKIHHITKQNKSTPAAHRKSRWVTFPFVMNDR